MRQEPGVSIKQAFCRIGQGAEIAVAVKNGEGFAVLEVSQRPAARGGFDFDFILCRNGKSRLFDYECDRERHQICTGKMAGGALPSGNIALAASAGATVF